MKYLFAGQESQACIELLLQLTSISSEPITDAIIDVLVKGDSETLAASFRGIKKSNLTRALTVLNRTTAIVEQIKELDWDGYQLRKAITTTVNS